MNALAQRSLSSTAFGDEVAVVPTLDSLTSTTFPQHRVVVATHSSPWMRDLSSRFDEVVSLTKGWDGYSGVPVSFTTAQFAAQMIERLWVPGVPTPSIVPGTDGSVQVEWHAGGFDVELDVLEPLEVEAYRLNRKTGEVDELEIESDFSQIAQWISDIALARKEATSTAG
ncbi:hypothetical protein [Nitratireductor aquibiodomus]|uniref:hypothetical protein n=1 Tax=Nitratireductor aquibiodomus TaxID=204799 RepID=UPI0012FE702B|nr:hypothetical protein [Nitratireductor aquibiodomus]